MGQVVMQERNEFCRFMADSPGDDLRAPGVPDFACTASPLYCVHDCSDRSKKKSYVMQGMQRIVCVKRTAK